MSGRMLVLKTFAHPLELRTQRTLLRIPERHPMRRHVLYRLDRASFRRTLSSSSSLST